MTIGMWVVAIILAIVGVFWGIVHGISSYEGWGGAIVIWVITLVIVCGIIGVGHWYCANTAGGARALKDQKSELHNGLMREITITAEDGREIFHYKGKCDIETDKDNYILFEDENGLRQIIYWGVTDTIIISELPE